MTEGHKATWPDEIIERAVAGDLVVVVGAGASRGATNGAGESPPSWPELIRGLIVPAGAKDHEDQVEKLLAAERMLDAAELVSHRMRQNMRQHDFYKKLRTLVDGPSGDVYQDSPLHSAVLRLEPQIVVTTNYDRIMERASKSGYHLHGYSSRNVGSDVRRGEPVLLKLHGSVDEVDDVILTQRDYTRLRLDGSHALEVLAALFLTRVALFVGYSLRDPDMRLLLENVLGGRHLAPAHYVLSGADLPDYERNILAYSYGVSVVEYPAGDHNAASTMLNELADLMEANRSG